MYCIKLILSLKKKQQQKFVSPYDTYIVQKCSRIFMYGLKVYLKNCKNYILNNITLLKKK
jgi:hypothetical protein